MSGEPGSWQPPLAPFTQWLGHVRDPGSIPPLPAEEKGSLPLALHGEPRHPARGSWIPAIAMSPWQYPSPFVDLGLNLPGLQFPMRKMGRLIMCLSVSFCVSVQHLAQQGPDLSLVCTAATHGTIIIIAGRLAPFAYQQHKENEEDIGDEVNGPQHPVGVVNGIVVKVAKYDPKLGETRNGKSPRSALRLQCIGNTA